MRLSGVLVYAPPDIRDVYSPSRWELWLLQMRQRLQTPLRKPADVEANQPVATGCNCLQTGLAILPAYHDLGSCARNPLRTRIPVMRMQ